MEIWQAVVLGIIQGASEFLPISSSGHLLLLEKLGIGHEDLFFNICLHLGTLLAVLIALYKEWLPLLKHPFQKKTAFILAASLPTVIMAIVFKLFLPSLIQGEFLAFGFVLTAILIFVGEKLKFAKNKTLSFKSSVLSGVLQGIAVLPGVSRSGATIASLSACGIDRETAANFSFLLSIPIILGSALFEGASIALDGTLFQIDVVAVIVGAVASFLSGLIAIKLFLKLVKKHTLLPFALYTLLLGFSLLVAGFN